MWVILLSSTILKKKSKLDPRYNNLYSRIIWSSKLQNVQIDTWTYEIRAFMITEHIIWWTGKRTIAYFVIVMGLTCHVCISHEYLSRFNSELYYSLLLILAINRISPMYVVQHLIVRNIQKVSKLKFCRWFIMIQHKLYHIDPYLS